MSGKNDLQNASSVQNLVVYVSNDGFPQEFNPHNVQENRHSDIRNGTYTNQPHSLATMVDYTTKQYLDKSNILKTDYLNRQLVNGSVTSQQPQTQGNYISGIPSHNGFTQPNVNFNYHNGGSVINEVKSYGLITGETQAGPERLGINFKVQECESIDTSYVTVMGAEGPPQSVRCESVRSETAESSCSSLSSVEEGVVTVVQNQPSEMVVYESGVNVRPSGVVLTVGSPAVSLHTNSTTVVGPVNNVQLMPITVPYGWKRLLNNGSVIYISPSNAALDSPDQVKEYLLSAGTCKCGLECPLKYEKVFNFDPKVPGKPWTPDATIGDLTKLCNHKRKIYAMDSKLLDPNIRFQKDYSSNNKKKKINSYCGGVSVSDMLSHREKLSQQHLKKETEIINQPMWSDSSINHLQISSSRIQGFPDINQQKLRYQNQNASTNRVMADSSLIIDETMMAQSPSQQNISEQNVAISSSNPNIHIRQHHMIGSNGQVINVQGSIIPSQVQDQLVSNQNVQNTNPNSSIVIQPSQVQSQPQEHRVYINEQPNEPSGPGRPNLQMMPFNLNNPQRPDLTHKQFYNNHFQHYDNNKYIRPFVQNNHGNGYRPPNLTSLQNSLVRMEMSATHQQTKLPWQNRIQNLVQQFNTQENQVCAPIQNINQVATNVYERVPPLHLPQNSSNMWQEELKRKKKHGKNEKKRPYNFMESNVAHSPCPNIDVRQIPTEGSSRAVIINQLSRGSQSASSPSFMEDPSGYLAQQTALLNSTINRQTGVCTQFTCNNSNSPMSNHHSHLQSVSGSDASNNQMPSPSSTLIKQQNINNRINQNINIVKSIVPHDVVISQQYNQIMTQSVADSSALNEHCQSCLPDSNQYLTKDHIKITESNTRGDSKPCTPNSSDDSVTSSTYSEKHINQSSPDTRPIQGGTVSTSNVSPAESGHSDSPTPCSSAVTPPQHLETLQNINNSNMPFTLSSQTYLNKSVNQSQIHNSNLREVTSLNYPNMIVTKSESCHYNLPQVPLSSLHKYTANVVTTMASGRTVGSNTITSVLAGRASTATVSINNPANTPATSAVVNTGANSMIQSQAANISISKSPLEMVQSVVSSIQIPHSQQSNVLTSTTSSNSQLPHIMKHSAPGLPPGHILVSSCGQIIMANTGTNNPTVMAPPPPKMINNQGMPPISVSPLVTNVTAAVSQVIPAVAQQVLGQQTVLVNTLPTPFVLQPGVAMAVDGMTVSQNVPLPQIVTSNMLQQQIQIDHNSDPRRTTSLLSPEIKKKGKKRKISSSPTVASMLQIAAAQQNQGIVMSPQGYPQQVQMAHSPQGLATGQVVQALTIVPSKNGGAHQLVMNSQPMSNTGHIGTQQLITNSQPAQQINLLQPVNLINSATGVVQNFPTIQQFIVPNLGGMVMNPDGTATILQDTSNLGMQLQIQTLNGQNVLTPVQNNSVFNGSQNILAAGPAGMVIRAPSSQNKIIHQQQHSPGAQFLSPNGGQFVVNGAQFSGQLSPLVASVSPSQQVTFSTSPQQMRSANSAMQQAQQEYIQCGQMGQTLMVPCTPAGNIAVTSSNQNATYVQQNTTIVQQHTTMVSNNQQMHNFPPHSQHSQTNLARTPTINVDPNFLISASDNTKQLQLQVNASSYRQSVSTQTAVNQNAQAVTTNTFCQTSTSSAGSPPDTTTHSPLAMGGESPLAADTTTHTDSTDDGLSPAPSNCSINCDATVQGKSQQSCTMAMVHCISSSEPDLPDINTQGSDTEWSRQPPVCITPKSEYTDVTSAAHLHFSKKCTTPTYAESSTVGNLQFLTPEQLKPQEATISSHTFEKVQKRKFSNSLIIESQNLHSSFFDDDEEVAN